MRGCKSSEGKFCEMECDNVGTENKTKLPLITTILVAVNVVIFLAVDLFLFKRQDEITFTMALNPFFVIQGKEYWRLFTSMFYHFGIDHLACNMLMLFLLGGILEPLFGKVKFVILYFVSGLVADGASILYNGVIRSETDGFVFCAGASGAVYGLIGAFVALFLFQREKMPVYEKRRLAVAVAFLLFGSIFDTGVGHDAHFGGFLAGILTGLLYCRFLWRKQQTKGSTQE